MPSCVHGINKETVFGWSWMNKRGGLSGLDPVFLSPKLRQNTKLGVIGNI